MSNDIYRTTVPITHRKASIALGSVPLNGVIAFAFAASREEFAARIEVDPGGISLASADENGDILERSLPLLEPLIGSSVYGVAPSPRAVALRVVDGLDADPAPYAGFDIMAYAYRPYARVGR